MLLAIFRDGIHFSYLESQQGSPQLQERRMMVIIILFWCVFFFSYSNRLDVYKKKNRFYDSVFGEIVSSVLFIKTKKNFLALNDIFVLVFEAKNFRLKR